LVEFAAQGHDFGVDGHSDHCAEKLLEAIQVTWIDELD